MFVFLENVFVYQHNLISQNNTPLLLPDICILMMNFCIHHVATIISTLNNNISKITISQLWPNMFKSIFQSQLFFAFVFILYVAEIMFSYRIFGYQEFIRLISKLIWAYQKTIVLSLLFLSLSLVKKLVISDLHLLPLAVDVFLTRCRVPLFFISSFLFNRLLCFLCDLILDLSRFVGLLGVISKD